MNRRASRGLPLVCLLLSAAVASPALAQTPGPGAQDPAADVTVVLEGRQRSAFRLAMPAPGGTARLGAELAEAGRTLDATLRADLEYSRVFLLQGPTQLAVLTLTGEQSRDFELYRSLGNELLLEVDLLADGERLVLEGRVFDLGSGKAILGKRYRGAPSAARRMAHNFADEMVLFFSGRPGVASSSIAFLSDRTGFKEVFLMDYDGASQRQITAHKTISLAPDWSPTGQEIAYVSYFSGWPGIYLADVATGRKSPVATDQPLNTSPSFAPDGRRIAFGKSVGGGNTEIFVVNRDGSDLRRLTHQPPIDTNPAWSPSGREIAFTSGRGGSPQIYTMDAEGANLRRISREGGYNDGAAWSPDGTRLVYATRRSGQFAVAVTDLVTLETRLLVSGVGNHESPSFSPDGKKIVFASKKQYGSRGETQIYVMDADGSNLRQITSSGNNSAPSWSPFLR